MGSKSITMGVENVTGKFKYSTTRNRGRDTATVGDSLAEERIAYVGGTSKLVDLSTRMFIFSMARPAPEIRNKRVVVTGAGALLWIAA
jgi:hypothetical protein